jgi:NMD protein affecting ribosome stability and mRNA decay
MPKPKIVDATMKDRGKCLGCGKESKLVDGYLCNKCFRKEAPDFEEK